MPRQARLDAPGTLHHVMGRGIERTKIFQTDTDRTDFVTRLAALCQQGHLVVYAWALLPNHFHLLLRTGTRPLAQSLKRLLTGYVVNFNRRQKRAGHLFQNRYTSIVVEEEPYLLELVRYLHLNPLRARLVPDLRALARYPWTGHSALLGTLPRPWQDTRTILTQFGPRPRRARAAYQAFVQAGIARGRRPELVGGGLLRSRGGWAQVLALRRKGSLGAADARILGRGAFVAGLLAEAARREKETLRRTRPVRALPALARHITGKEGIAEGALRSGRRTRALVRARRLFCQLAVRGMGYSGAEVARFLGVTTSAVNRLAVSEELPEVGKYPKAL